MDIGLATQCNSVCCILVEGRQTEFEILIFKMFLLIKCFFKVVILERKLGNLVISNKQLIMEKNIRHFFWPMMHFNGMAYIN